MSVDGRPLDAAEAGKAIAETAETAETVAEAARVLRAGGLVAFPTETVYGLGADATSDMAVAGIFKAKGRPSDHPLIVHVAAGIKGTEALSRFAQPLPLFAQKLVQVFWPGPLTLVVTRQPGVGGAAAGGQETIGLRCPSHRWRRRCSRPAPNWACPAWRAPVPTASAASARPPPSTCATSSATACW
jgi:tRNA threonylcarbamoyl adenosine modification protein (Sua5/YciO/YrdC/YwlC family)